MFNSDIPEWVVVRDPGKGLAYEGWVHAFSDTADDNELFLRDVRVLNNTTGDEVYRVWGLYLARPRGELTIEFTGREMTPREQRNAEGENYNQEEANG